MEQIEIKPYSNNFFIKAFQKIYRYYLGTWYGFNDKHPKLGNLLYKIGFFFLFSMAVTVIQFLIMLFLPYAFSSIWDIPFCFPRVNLGLKDASGNDLFFGIFNEPVQILLNGKLIQAYTCFDVNHLLSDGGVIKAGGLGNFIAFEIAVFLAQCINFPLQRNITYKSKGNPFFQAFMYFIGWIGVSIFTNALWGIANPLLLSWQVNEVLISLLKTILTGGVSMVIFFFIFLIIFPNLENARLEYIKESCLYNSKAISYFSYLNKKEKEDLVANKYEEAIRQKEKMKEAKAIYDDLYSKSKM
ncbi:MAG TPA: hypothetical protein DD377_06265 [Firmicutes bacterium]|nr:hypothetical protein [Bacillota bacterium]